MIKKIGAISILVSLVLAATPVLALPNPSTSGILTLPQAADNSTVISLGTAVDPQSGKVVEGFAIIHPKKGYHHKPDHSKGSGGNGDRESKCFSFLAKGAKWKSVEPWVVNTSNNAGLDGSFVFNNLTADIAKWEDAADGTVGDGSSVNILGNGSTTSNTLVADTSSPDGQNEVYFADVSSSGAIAVTIVWGIFGGPPFARELVEWDQIYDDVDFDWSSIGEAGKMDFENIATHELGHSVGLGHPDDSCAEETMYRFADFGETKKQTLEAGDIAGTSSLY